MILQSRRVWVLNDWLEAQVEISAESGRIERICPYGACVPDMDFGDLRLVPGFIDVHTHGAYGFDTNDAEEQGLKDWLEKVVGEGVTGILPTTITQSEEVLTGALRNVAEVARQQRRDPESVPGAQILGIHFEGPYLDQTYKGAQPEQFCVTPDVDQFKRYLTASDGLIRIVTLACEHDEDYCLTRFLREHGIIPSLGHSSATYAQAAMAFANGVRSVTHVYNGMAPYHHREPGIPGAAFCFRNVFGEIICDGLHSTWGAIRTFFTNKGPDYGVMVTDSLRVKGLPAGTRVLFGGNLIELYEDGSAHLVGAGNLAGSTLKMNEGLRNLVEKACLPWQTAINACTLNPARLIGLEASKGSLQAGKDADIAVLRDDYSVEAVFVVGKRRF
ncbi:MAG: N-acetylglucosamine-6-phosphate deacetylase [Eubacteriales bacterium]|nr:N-acetylglucosamine-6-phosphate deacetylase [Eubacteriales bacterium]